MVRREFLESATGLAAGRLINEVGGNTIATGSNAWRSEFPSLNQQINGHPLVYLDSAATALRPRPVIDALTRFYSLDNANPGAALHTLARRAHAALEGARATVASFIGARDPLEVIFTRGTTEGLNLVAATWVAATDLFECIEVWYNRQGGTPRWATSAPWPTRRRSSGR